MDSQSAANANESGNVDGAPLGRRHSDRARADAAHVSDAAEYLLKRRAALDHSLRAPGALEPASAMGRTPPRPAALLMIESVSARQRFMKVLAHANIEVEEHHHFTDALASLTDGVHALMLTDRVEFICAARQLPEGSATHVIFISRDGSATEDEALRAGADECLPAEASGQQFWARMMSARRIVELAAFLQTAVTDNRILSTLDELTHCGSRRFFEHQFPREVQRAARLGKALTLVMCDIDHFKSINDRYGHQAGDLVLREFADRIAHTLRVHSDWVARVGGEEFAIVLPEANDHEGPTVAERLRQAVAAAPFQIDGQAIEVTASFGVCSRDARREEASRLPDAMVHAADTALYESKRSGRNRVTVHTAH